MAELPEYYKHDRRITAKYIGRKLREAGGHGLEKALKVNGEVKKFFIVRNYEDYADFIANDNIKGAFEVATTRAKLQQEENDKNNIIIDSLNNIDSF
jgi:hypothetical protein